MRKFFRKIYRSQIIRLIAKLFLSLFYEKKYLNGRWFNQYSKGYIWCLKGILFQKILGFNRCVPWPVSHLVTISEKFNIIFDINDLNNFQSPGCYYQCFNAKIIIGSGTYIGPNVGIITSNHNINNLDEHEEGKDVIIGKNCWIGMNSVLLPGVVLGDKTIVGAGSVVTKSFPEGNIVIAGNPARVIKKL